MLLCHSLSNKISKSKIACQLASGWEGSGRYTKINSVASIADESDITITFDNKQKVGRHSGRIHEGSKQTISIITDVSIISSQYQFEQFNKDIIIILSENIN